ncbi:putative cobalt transporter subunit CbtB [Prauserella shujinwangii]|uniref:Putative cobalt transporter subunit CbtB n=1 Tax=Prauserella shujinwangii TaxID=1453103 RepID=A0A2T0LW49_9PSEU|nr:CbtB domain-containing protein [Prauserella shujinwangii]PRX48244.1 putative cobalt transporter subunit CbtB [Prauserella shujinwangii]
MSQPTIAAPHPVQIRIPLREIVPWAIFAGILSLVVLFFVTTEAGAVELLSTGGLVHEFLHDGRHLLAFPCH